MNRRFRSLVVVGLAAVLAGGGSDPASAEPASPEPGIEPNAPVQQAQASTVTTMQVSGCDFTVTYTWSGQKGRNLIATFGLYERKAGLDASFNVSNVEGQTGRGGSVTHTFRLAANREPAGRMVVGRGALVDSKTFRQVEGSSSASGTVFSTCG